MSPTRTTSNGQVLTIVSAAEVALSQRYATNSYRATANEWPTWTPVDGVVGGCDECSMLQHESRGKYGPRRSPSNRRGFPDGAVLYLCDQHSQAWRERDAADTQE